MCQSEIFGLSVSPSVFKCECMSQGLCLCEHQCEFNVYQKVSVHSKKERWQVGVTGADFQRTTAGVML